MTWREKMADALGLGASTVPAVAKAAGVATDAALQELIKWQRDGVVVVEKRHTGKRPEPSVVRPTPGRDLLSYAQTRNTEVEESKRRSRIKGLNTRRRKLGLAPVRDAGPTQTPPAPPKRATAPKRARTADAGWDALAARVLASVGEDARDEAARWLAEAGSPARLRMMQATGKIPAWVGDLARRMDGLLAVDRRAATVALLRRLRGAA